MRSIYGETVRFNTSYLPLGVSVRLHICPQTLRFEALHCSEWSPVTQTVNLIALTWEYENIRTLPCSHGCMWWWQTNYFRCGKTDLTSGFDGPARRSICTSSPWRGLWSCLSRMKWSSPDWSRTSTPVCRELVRSLVLGRTAWGTVFVFGPVQLLHVDIDPYVKTGSWPFFSLLAWFMTYFCLILIKFVFWRLH